MTNGRSRYEGLALVVQFNWHLYAIALLIIIALITTAFFISGIRLVALFTGIALLYSLISSLIVTHWIYDRSALYRLSWLDGLGISSKGNIISLHAGFDDFTPHLKLRYPKADHRIFDFFDSKRQTERSIRRARNYGNVEPGISVSFDRLPMEDHFSDTAFLFLSAHEIRGTADRAVFFRELSRVMRVGGQIIVVEHLRNAPNFLAYNIGAFHFFSRKTWLDAFDAANLGLSQERFITPFIRVFVLCRN